MLEKIAMVIAGKNKKAADCGAILNSSIPEHLKIVRPKDADLILALGGDGLLMKAMHKYYNLGKPFLGLNCGHTGFLLNEIPSVFDRIGEDLHNANLNFYIFPIFDFWGEDTAGNRFDGIFVGDLYFNRVTERSGESSRLNVFVDGKEIAHNMTGDGLVVCSALGSTAYFFNAGGSPLHPLLPVIGIASIVCRPAETLRIILPNYVEVMVKIVEPQKRQVVVSNDDVGLPKNNVLWVKIRKSDKTVALGFWKNHDFTQTIVKKILKSQEKRP